MADQPITTPPNVKVIKADTLLQSKIGSGPLDAATVARCQDVIDSNNYDFAPLARDYLQTLRDAITEIRDNAISTEAAVQKLTEPVMQLKAHAAMFRYALIGNMANIMLSFLEAIKSVDEDVIQIIEAHHQTLTAIVAKKMEGDGGTYGRQLEDELKSACKRYFSKKPVK